MYKIIKAGHHYPTRLHWPILLYKSAVFYLTRTFVFTGSCIYYFGDVDDGDKNKLYGIVFSLLPKIKNKRWAIGKDVRVMFSFWNWIVINPIHWNSVRIGWCCNYNTKKIILTPYIFKNGVRTYVSSINLVDINDPISMSLEIDKESGYISGIVYRKDTQIRMWNIHYDLNKHQYLYYYADVYFGGNKTAPHNIIIEEVKI